MGTEHILKYKTRYGLRGIPGGGNGEGDGGDDTGTPPPDSSKDTPDVASLQSQVEVLNKTLAEKSKELDTYKELGNKHEELKKADSARSAEITKLRGELEAKAQELQSYATLKTDHETTVTELKGLKDSLIKETQNRLIASGLRSEDLADKDLTTLRAMEISVNAVRKAKGDIPASSGIGGDKGEGSDGQLTPRERALQELDAMKKNPGRAVSTSSED